MMIRYEKWGLTPSEYDAHAAQHGSSTCPSSPMRKYVIHRANAAKRNLDWGFTFISWWAVWQESGKWDKRGRGPGYCMARKGDVGGYSPDNVYICTNSKNFSDSYIKTPHEVRFANFKNCFGKGKGYYRDSKRSYKKPYVANCRGVHLGSFATAEEAREAYLFAVLNGVPERCGPTKKRAKLSRESAAAIFIDARKATEIARDFGVSACSVRDIKARRTWKCL